MEAIVMNILVFALAEHTETGEEPSVCPNRQFGELPLSGDALPVRGE